MTQMSLSAAIRLGAMLKPQAHNGEETEASCALRAAADACGIADSLCLNYSALEDRFPVLNAIVTEPVETAWLRPGVAERRVIAIIFSLNDTLKWTRERIADWVEALEAQHATTAINPVGEFAKESA